MPGYSPLASKLGAMYPNVSRYHAEVWLEGGVLYVRDLGSANGTFVNGKPIGTEPVVLGDGDQLRFAANLTATVRIPAHGR